MQNSVVGTCYIRAKKGDKKKGFHSPTEAQEITPAGPDTEHHPELWILVQLLHYTCA